MTNTNSPRLPYCGISVLSLRTVSHLYRLLISNKCSTPAKKTNKKHSRLSWQNRPTVRGERKLLRATFQWCCWGWRNGESTRLHSMSPGVKIPASTPYVGWVCYSFSPLHREVFLRVLRFFPILKNQHFEILIRSGRTRTRFNKLLRTPKCSVGKQITITITKKYFALQYLSFLLRLTPASFPVLGEFGFVWAIGFGSKPPRLFGQRE